MHADFSAAPRYLPPPPRSAEKLEYIEAVKKGRAYNLSFMDFLAIPGTPENDEMLGDLCLLKSLCDRYGYRIKGACTIHTGPCPFTPIGNKLVGWEFLPSPERFWIRDDFGALNPVPVDSKLARVLRDAFNEQLLEHFNTIRTAISPIPCAFMTRVNPEMEVA